MNWGLFSLRFGLHSTCVEDLFAKIMETVLIYNDLPASNRFDSFLF
jgi:hypothetical protein